ncbi:MAG: hypothetical protein IRZ04_03635 [Rhodospirillales bacterium]|nr:hypothetical protein [Rhodospirillales bacterium]
MAIATAPPPPEREAPRETRRERTRRLGQLTNRKAFWVLAALLLLGLFFFGFVVDRHS